MMPSKKKHKSLLKYNINKKKQLNIPLVFTSCKNNLGVFELFYKVAE